jgi:hypothetical protein
MLHVIYLMGVLMGYHISDLMLIYGFVRNMGDLYTPQVAV